MTNQNVSIDIFIVYSANSDRFLNTILEEEENVSLLPLQHKTITTLVTAAKSLTPLSSPECSIPSKRTTQLFHFSSADPPNVGGCNNSSFLNNTQLEKTTTSSISFSAKDSMSAASHNALSNITNDTTKISVRRKLRDNILTNVNSIANQTQENDSMLNVIFSPQELCHSTPNRRSSRIQNATTENESSMQSKQSSTSINGRPKRKAAPTNLIEPNLTKKLRNRTNKRL